MSSSSDRPSRLNSLELQGYKTFATKTRFEFAPTITAIVGPNGSGKSNIADAIRWVLGEQSYSLLRGKRTEDMIFSGSDIRARAGMAAATIQFDNADGWLPIDFSEVSVGRRAYRDGQNEYLINGQKVRLRDVSEMLAESGLAERTYTVIGQGLVDTALSLRAEERRELFEEAAGIGLYRSRREEAVRRLENTRRNLERVQDILSELRPRLRSLERQAQRARDYEQVKQDLQESLRSWYGFHWNTMLARVSEARRHARAQAQERAELRRKQEKVERELKATREKIDRLREKLQGWSDESTDLYGQRERQGREVAVLEERLRWLEEQRSLMRGEIDALEETRAALQGQIKEAEQELEQRQAQVEQLEGDEGDETGLASRRELEERAAEARRELEDLAGRKAAWQARREQLEGRRDELARQVEQAQAELEAAQTARSEAEEQARRLQEQRDKLEQERRRWAERAQAAETKHEELQAKLDEAREARGHRASKLARLEARLAAVRELLEGAHGAARLLLEAAEKGDLPGVVGRLVAQLKVPKQHRTAVATALGELFGGIALRSQDDLTQALEYLERQSSQGRTVLLAPVAGQPSSELSLPDRAGVLGIASELVQAESGAAELVAGLLARTVVVQDRKTAQKLIRQLPDGAQVVTSAGELFLSEGTVIVGPPERGPDRAERERLESELDQLRGQLETERVQVQELAESVEATAQELADARQQRETAQHSLVEAGEEHQEAELQRREAVREEERLRQRWENLQSEFNALDSKGGALDVEEEGFVDERRRLERALAEAQRRLSRWGEGEDRPQQEAEWDSARRGVEEARDRLEERQARLKSIESELQGWRERLERNRAEREQKQAELEAAKGSSQELEQRLRSRRDELEPAEAELREAEKRRAELEAAESKLRAEVQAVDNRHSQAQIELARREEELAGLQRRIEDDFGLVAYEYDDETTGQEPLPLKGLVEKLPAVDELPEGAETQVKRLRAQLRRMGSVNPEAQKEFESVKERAEFMTGQVDDLRRAESQMQEVIAELDVIMAREFRKTFEAVAGEFKQSFTRLFGGGSATLALSDPDDPNQSGIEIEARLPGKREQGLAVLSGGERSLTASALIFALLKVSPTPFCVLDEVDAMLDEANVGRFCEMLQELSQRTQFIVITHNRQTVQVAQAVYGISMSADSTSKAISLDLDEAAREIAA